MSLLAHMVASGRKVASIECDECGKPLVESNAFYVIDCGDRVANCLACKSKRKDNKIFKRESHVAHPSVLRALHTTRQAFV